MKDRGSPRPWSGSAFERVGGDSLGGDQNALAAAERDTAEDINHTV
jgi:hypothetical protein